MNKKLIIGLMLGLSLSLAFGFQRTRSGDIIQPTELDTPMSLWEDLGTITAVNATLAVTAQDYSSVEALPDANTIEWDVDNDDSGIFLAFECTGDANAYVTEMWVSASNSSTATYSNGTTEDDFTLGAIFTLTGGTKVSGTGTFIDTAVVTASTGVLATAMTVLDSGNNRKALIRFDGQGWKGVRFINTTHEAGTTFRAVKRDY